MAFPARGQMQIKVNDTVNIKFGILMQTQADALQDGSSRKYAQNLFIRRARILMGGQVAPNLSFFAETDAPNLGKSVTTGTKNIQPSMYLQDAYAEYKFSDALLLDAGLLLISPSRNGLQSAASLMPIDYGSYTFSNSGPTQSTAGRDTGIQARGYLAGKKFEYRIGAFQGTRDLPNRAFRLTGRFSYNFLDPEAGYFYTGTYLGKKKVLALGGGFDHQNGYDGRAIDLFYDHPLGGGALTTQLGFLTYDGGTFLKSLPEQKDAMFEIGYLFGGTKLMPVAQFVKRNVAAPSKGDENRIGVGLNYFMTGHNANFKAMYTRIDPDSVRKSNQFTVQLQLFYF